MEGALGEYYVGIAGAAVGPLTQGEVEQRLARGEIAPRTYVWHPGLASWQRLARVAELQHLLPRVAVSAPSLSAAPSSADSRTLEERLGVGYMGEASPSSAPGAQPAERRVRLGAANQKAPPPSDGTSLLVGLVISLALGVALGALL